MYSSDLGAKLTQEELESYSKSLATYLRSKGVKAGDRVGVMMPNLVVWPVVIKAVWALDAVLVNINPLASELEVGHIIHDSGLKTAIVWEPAAHLWNKFKGLVISTFPGFKCGVKGPLINFAVKMKLQYPAETCVQICLHNIFHMNLPEFEPSAMHSPLTLRMIQYTGGTTGMPKGVMITQGNLDHQLNACLSALDGLVKPGDTVIAPLPMYHVYAFLIHALVLPALGAKSHFITNPRDLDKFSKTLDIVDYQGMVGINTLFNGLNNKKPKYGNKLKFAISGGMALDKTVAAEFTKQTGAKIIEGYGLTEHSPVISLNDTKKPRIGSAGKLLEGVEAKIADDGELLVRSPSVALGYWDRTDTETFREDGWLATGDIAKFDEDGFLWITDRKKNMILVSGFNVYPTEVESVINTLRAVVESAVIGEKNGVEEIVTAYIVTSSPLDEAEVLAICQSHLSAYKVPKKIYFVDDLPKTPVGKILHRKVKEMHLDKHGHNKP